MTVKNSFIKILGLSLTVFMLWGVSVFAAQYSFQEAGAKAKEYQDLSQSDIIYAQESSKALYYQNIQIIQLLSEIRDDLSQVKSKMDELQPKEISTSN